MSQTLRTISQVIETLERTLIVAAVLSMMENSTANAIGRYFFNQSIFFAEELNQFLIVSVTFIGFAYAVRQGRNIRMTAVYDALGQGARKVIATIIALCTGLLMFYLAYLACFYVLELKELNRLSPALQFPVYIVYSIIPLGLAMAGIQFMLAFVMNLYHREIFTSSSHIEEREQIGEGL
jgi:TRAP-type C4-dicarboxylate transport system permease small subunit